MRWEEETAIYRLCKGMLTDRFKWAMLE